MKNKGNAGSLFAVFVIGLVALVLLTGIGLMGRTKTGTKKVVALSAAADAAWAELENALKPRFDLIPGLVETARPYATDSQDLFAHIATARNAYAAAGTPEAKVEAATQLEALLPQLLALPGQYPPLQSNETFRALTTALAATAPAVSTARTHYNDAARALNDYIATPFGARLAQKSAIPPRPYSQAPAPAKTEDQEPPAK